MNFSLPPFLQQYISPAFSGQTPPQLGEKKFTPETSVASQVRSGSASANLQESNRFNTTNFLPLPTQLVPQVGCPKGCLGYKAPGSNLNFMA